MTEHKKVLKIDVSNLSKKEVIKKVDDILYRLKNKKARPIEPKWWPR